MIDLPIEFKNNMKQILNEEYDLFIDTYNYPPYKGLRINTLKISDESLLKEFNLTSIPWCTEGYYYNNSTPGKHVYHEMGLYYLQEPSAMSAVQALDVQKGDMVLDLCAAPGGKSTQIASHLQGEGLLVSNEIIPSRAKVLSSNIERMGIKNAIVTNEDPKKLVNNFAGFFNKILVDAPCSGEGMFRKNNDAIKEWSMENVLMCAKRQEEILDIAEKMLQDDGTIVFSTCTFSKYENESVVEKFLLKHKDFICEKQERLYPHKINGEGHFYAVLKRNGIKEYKKLEYPALKKMDKNFVQFARDALNIPLSYNLCYGDNLYYAPKVNLNGIKTLRVGLHLGELKKNRFEPSHSLALALESKDFKNVVLLDKDSLEVKKYIAGESIISDVKGWACVSVDNYPLGWIKGDGNIAKNHYPKGLRKEL